MIARYAVRHRRDIGVLPQLLSLASALFLLSCRSPAPAVDHTEETATERRRIEARLADWTRWTAAGQIDSVADLFTSDAWEADPNLPPVNGRQAILDHWRRGVTMGQWAFEPHIDELLVHDSLAVERTSYTLRYTAHAGAQGPPSFEDRGSWVNVWRKDSDGAWRIRWTIAASTLPLPGGP